MGSNLQASFVSSLLALRGPDDAPPPKGRDASDKLRQVRDWVEAHPPAVPFYSKAAPTPAQMYVATLITSLSNIGMSSAALHTSS